jgi:hypothetical protein
LNRIFKGIFVKLSFYVRNPSVSEISRAYQNGQSCSLKEQWTTKMTPRPALMTQIHPDTQIQQHSFILDYSELISQVGDLQNSNCCCCSALHSLMLSSKFPTHITAVIAVLSLLFSLIIQCILVYIVLCTTKVLQYFSSSVDATLKLPFLQP